MCVSLSLSLTRSPKPRCGWREQHFQPTYNDKTGVQIMLTFIGGTSAFA